MIGGSTTLVKQTMIVPATARVAESAGWGIRLQFMGGKPRASVRQLTLEHCTVAGSGLLQLAGFSPQSPLQVEARRCAVKAERTSRVGKNSPRSFLKPPGAAMERQRKPA